MKLWQKDSLTDKAVEQFTVGQDRDLDLRLACFDILGSLAHTRMLAEVGLLETIDYQALLIEKLRFHQAA